MSGFDYVVGTDGLVTRAVLTGELDLARHDRLDRLLTDLEPHLDGTVVLDCRQLAFLDARGATLLARLARTASSRGGSMVAVGASKRIERVLAVVDTGADLAVERRARG